MLNHTLSSIDESPITATFNEQKSEQKLEKAIDKIKSRMADATNTTVLSTAEKDMNRLVQLLKAKLAITPDHLEKMKLLTLAPTSWTYEQIMMEFGFSRRLVWR